VPSIASTVLPSIAQTPAMNGLFAPPQTRQDGTGMNPDQLGGLSGTPAHVPNAMGNVTNTS